jgi:hypothetical protein
MVERIYHGAADFGWAIYGAQRTLAHQNPYDTPLSQYPVTADFLALPFVHLQPAMAAGLFYGISSGLLAFGLTRNGYHRLFIFLAFPYWAGLITAQWCTIIAAGAFFPLLLPVVMAKPQVGLPVLLTHISRRGALSCLILGILTLVFVPHWPFLWLHQFRYYQHFIPLLAPPGPLLLLALLRYRHRDAILLLLSAMMPQRWFFDSFILWLIPKSRREILATIPFGWGVGIWHWYHMPRTMHEVGLWTVLGIYLPMLAVVLLRPGSHGSVSRKEQGEHLLTIPSHSESAQGRSYNPRETHHDS